MNTNSKHNKTNFLRLFLANLNSVSSSKDSAKNYLISEGLDPDAIVSDSLKHIKRSKLQIQARITLDEMTSLDSLKEKAEQLVLKLMSQKGFSFADFVKAEGLALQNRNIETFTNEDIKNTLIQYYALKFRESQDEDSNGKKLQ